MIRRIVVLRHAQASSHSGGDFDRPLTDRGIKQTQRVASQLRAIGWQPTLALVSSARRTVQTAEIMATNMDAMEIISDRTLYLATGNTMIDALSCMPDHATTILLIGHNPGISEVAPLLTGDNNRTMLPTAGFIKLRVSIPSWNQLAPGCAEEET